MTRLRTLQLVRKVVILSLARHSRRCSPLFVQIRCSITTLNNLFHDAQPTFACATIAGNTAFIIAAGKLPPVPFR